MTPLPKMAVHNMSQIIIKVGITLRNVDLHKTTPQLHAR